MSLFSQQRRQPGYVTRLLPVPEDGSGLRSLKFSMHRHPVSKTSLKRYPKYPFSDACGRASTSLLKKSEEAAAFASLHTHSSFFSSTSPV